MEDTADLILADLMTTKLRLMKIEELTRELEFVIWVCEDKEYPNPPLTEAEFETLISTSLTLVGPERDNDNAWSRLLGLRERQMVGFQAHRVKLSLQHHRDYDLGEGLPQYALVPHDWVARMQLLLGQCTAPLATIQLPDALQ